MNAPRALKVVPIVAPAPSELEQLRMQRRALVHELAQVRFDRDVFANLAHARSVERDRFRNEAEELRARLAVGEAVLHEARADLRRLKGGSA